MNARKFCARGAVLLLGLGLCSLTPVARAGVTADQPSTARSVQLPVLTSVKARHKGSVDRVVFGFDGGAPASVQATWVDTLVHDGSGLPVRVAGSKVLSVVMTGAVAHDTAPTTRARTAFALPNVITAVRSGDFEGVVSFGLGVQRQTSYTVKTKADRVVVKVDAGFATTARGVWLVDRHAFATGQEPFVARVSRPVPAGAPAAGVLHALFAGPTPGERARGLRLVLSHAWEFTDLSIVDGIARVRLTHSCNSNGSTLTIAAEIMPTLRQFPTVDWVKIYAPNGQTENPSGASDSIPICLEP